MFLLVTSIGFIKFAAAPAAILLSQPGFTASYFNTKNLGRTPVFTRTEQEINLVTAPPGISQDEFSVRWEGMFTITTAGTYTFTITADDGIKMWIDGRLAISKWERNNGTYTIEQPLTTGQHSLKVEYFQQWGGYKAKVFWALKNPVTTTPATPVVKQPTRTTGSVKPSIVPDTLKPASPFDDLIAKASGGCNHDRYAYNSKGAWSKNTFKDKTICHEIVYSPNGLKLDLYLPNDGGNKNMPLIVWAHGGAFYLGGRFECAYDVHEFVNKGYAVACVSYRMAPLGINQQAPDEKNVPTGYFPDNLKDIKTAVQYLRKNAGNHYDPNKIIVGGHSAGGYFATMMAATNGVAEYNGYGDASVSSDVQGALVYAGISDFNAFMNHQLITDSRNFDDAKRGAQYTLSLLLGSWPSAKAAKADPVNSIDSTDAPMFIAHGTNDALVPLEVANALDRILTKVGVSHTLRTLKGGTHESVTSHSSVFNDAVRWLDSKFK
jgi:acetyl esterase/lipase